MLGLSYHFNTKKNTIEGQAGVVGTYGVKHLHLFTL